MLIFLTKCPKFFSIINSYLVLNDWLNVLQFEIDYLCPLFEYRWGKCTFLRRLSIGLVLRGRTLSARVVSLNWRKFAPRRIWGTLFHHASTSGGAGPLAYGSAEDNFSLLYFQANNEESVLLYKLFHEPINFPIYKLLSCFQYFQCFFSWVKKIILVGN